MFKAVAIICAIFAVAYSNPVAVDSQPRFEDQSGFNINDFIADLVSKLIISITDEVNAIVDFVLEMITNGMGKDSRSLQEQPETKAFIGKSRKSMIKQLLKLLTEIYDTFMWMIQQGIAISSQLMESLSEAIEMLLSGQMPPVDVLKALIVECLGILGRKRREIGSAAADSYAHKFYMGALEVAQRRMEVSPLFAQMTEQQRNTAAESVNWILQQVLAGRD